MRFTNWCWLAPRQPSPSPASGNPSTSESKVYISAVEQGEPNGDAGLLQKTDRVTAAGLLTAALISRVDGRQRCRWRQAWRQHMSKGPRQAIYDEVVAAEANDSPLCNEKEMRAKRCRFDKVLPTSCLGQASISAAHRRPAGSARGFRPWLARPARSVPRRGTSPSANRSHGYSRQRKGAGPSVAGMARM